MRLAVLTLLLSVAPACAADPDFGAFERRFADLEKANAELRRRVSELERATGLVPPTVYPAANPLTVAAQPWAAPPAYTYTPGTSSGGCVGGNCPAPAAGYRVAPFGGRFRR